MKTLRSLNMWNNGSWETERNAEIPMAFDYIGKYGFHNLIEIGAVTPYFGMHSTDHWVIDLHDPWEKCIRQDALTFPLEGRNVLSISTIEHIGLADYKTNGEALQDMREDGGVLMLKKIIAEAHHYLITFPLGYNQTLDKSIPAVGAPYSVFYRSSQYEWQEDTTGSLNYQYKDFPGGATAICVLQR